ncbi:MAG: bifunctional oligoribonuclease/PAP phosphatase NrnA [Thermoplasmata archaeon]
MYVILGSGKLAKNVANELRKLGKKARIIQSMEEITDADALLLLESREVRNQYDFPVMLYSDMESVDIAKGIDVLIPPGAVLASLLIKERIKYERIRRTTGLMDHIERLGCEFSVFLHDNPDPDAIASAMAFKSLCSHQGMNCRTYYSGDIGHPENELFVKATGVELINVKKDDIGGILEKDRPLVFLDFSQPSVNNTLPKDTVPDIVIDHHPSESPREKGGYVQIESDVGATSTLMTEHLLNTGLDIEPLLASALLYGIKVDTQGFTKNMGPLDFKAMSHLVPLCDTELFYLFESPSLNSSTVSSLGTAIINREVSNGIMSAYAGVVSTKDDVPQIAERLIAEKDVHTVIVFGKINEIIYMSARSTLTDIDLGKIMDKAFSIIGEAGGHPHAAAGAISLKEEVYETEVIKDLSNRFREEMS